MNAREITAQLVSPKEFTRLWNHILKCGKKELSSEVQLPKLILSLDDEPGMYSSILFIVERLNIDLDFQQEMVKVSMRNIYLEVVRHNNQVQVVAKQINKI